MSELMHERNIEKQADSFIGMSELELMEKLSAKTVDVLIEIIISLLRIISALNAEVNINVECSMKEKEHKKITR